MPLLGDDTLRVDIDGCVVDHSVDGPNRVHLIRHVLGLGSAREISDNQARRSIDEVHHALHARLVPRVEHHFVPILKQLSSRRVAQPSSRTRHQYTRHRYPIVARNAPSVGQ